GEAERHEVELRINRRVGVDERGLADRNARRDGRLAFALGLAAAREPPCENAPPRRDDRLERGDPAEYERSEKPDDQHPKACHAVAAPTSGCKNASTTTAAGHAARARPRRHERTSSHNRSHGAFTCCRDRLPSTHDR